MNNPVNMQEEVRIEERPFLAALPPAVQRMREIQAILAHPELYQILGSAEMIEKIEKTETGYLIETTDLSLAVEVVYRQTGKIGPAEFDLIFFQPVFRN